MVNRRHSNKNKRSKNNRRTKQNKNRRTKQNKNKRTKQNKNRRTKQNRRNRQNRRNQRAGSYRLNLNDQINGKAIVNPYYRCYNPVMGGGNCRTCGSNLENLKITELLKGGSNLSNLSGNMTQRTFGCRQPEWEPSCV
tara:strand:+ start:4694 stop:5107 length:414 start_codon:yes stop_codon:yes gene_type:complete